MRVRFVDVGNRFAFENPILAQGKQFKLGKKGLFGLGAEAEAQVQLEGGGVKITPSRGDLLVNDQPVRVSAILKHSDTVTVRRDESTSLKWQYQEDFVAAKKARQEREKADGIVRQPPNLAERVYSAKLLANRFRINEQGIELKSFFRWKQVRWDQLDCIEYLRTNVGGGLAGVMLHSASKAKGESEFVKLFDSGHYNIRFYANDGYKRVIGRLHEIPANSFVLLCEAIEYHAPFDLLRMLPRILS